VKTYTALFLLGTSLAAISIAGCDRPAERLRTQPNAIAGVHIDDSEVNQRVRLAFVQDEILNDFAITVETINGDVKLTGVVDNPGQSDYADKLVRRIEGAHTIHNHLTTKNPID
jgi:hyperosmotically inducible protein